MTNERAKELARQSQAASLDFQAAMIAFDAAITRGNVAAAEEARLRAHVAVDMLLDVKVTLVQEATR